MRITLLSSLLLLPIVALHADVTPNPIFAANAVLQQGEELPVWGTASDGEKITVAFAGQKEETVTKDGRWMVRLKAMKADPEPKSMTISGFNTITLTNLLVGEVWLCTGQSNMEWSLARSIGGSEAIAKSANPLLRMCRIPHNVQAAPQSEVKADWEECNPTTAKYFSAIPYWFGSKLQKELGVPVGIINSSFGGTQIQSWMPAATLKNGPWPQDKNFDPVLAREDYDRRAEAARPIREKYEADKAAALAQKLPPPPQPQGILSEYKGVSTLWNGEVSPMLLYRIRGVAWYQGESNAYVQVADTYKDLLPAMIKDWRAGFGQPDLPFLIFQIARNRKWQTDPNERSGIAELQESQLKTVLATPHTALVVTTDMGGPDVHYTRKEPIGERAVKAALALAYDRKVEYSGPIFKKAEFAAGKAIIHFNHADSGLESRDGPLAGFVIAGRDGKFFFADARIEGDTVVVASPLVPEPIAVRYGWADLPKVNLFNKEGMPASSFRTDDWPL